MEWKSLNFTHVGLLLSILALGWPCIPAMASPTQQAQEAATVSDGQEKPAQSQKVTVENYDVVVTATRSETQAGRVGQAVTVITAQEIEAQGARSLQQILEAVPGLNVVRTGSFGGTTSVFSRGGENNFNLVLIDGVAVNRPGGSFDFADLQTLNIDRVEVVRGPSSVLYGSDSVTSTINIITRSGEGALRGEALVEGGSFGSWLTKGGIRGSKGPLQYSLGGQISASDGILEFNNAYRNTTLSGNLVLEIAPGASFKASLHRTDTEYHFPTDSTGAVVDPNDFRDTNQTVFSAAFQGGRGVFSQMQFQYGYYLRDSLNFTLADGVVDSVDSVFRAREDRHSLEWHNDFQLGRGHLLTAGVGFDREHSGSGRLSRRSIGPFLQDQFSVSGRLFVTAGLRFEENDTFDDFTTAMVSASFLADDTFRLRGSLGNGFRAPSFTEIEGFPDFAILGNPDLKPEMNLSSDFGMDLFALQGRGRFSATAFFNQFHDLIEFSFAVPAGSPNYLNVEAARSHGLELEGFFDLDARWRLGAAYTWTETEVTDAGTVPGGSFAEGEPLLRRPRHLADIYVRLAHPRCTLRLDLKFKGRRDDRQFLPGFGTQRVVLPAYWKVDLALTVPISRSWNESESLSLIVRGNNVLDRDYNEIAGFQSAGRSLTAGLRVGF